MAPTPLQEGDRGGCCDRPDVPLYHNGNLAAGHSELVGGNCSSWIVDFLRICENDIMMEKENNKTKWLHVRLSIGENKQVNKEWKKTTCLKRSEYIRKIILGKPVVSTYRNLSLDDLMAELIRLRNDLNTVGNNFNQAVKKLHTIDRSVQVSAWISAYEQDKDSVMQAIENIENSIAKLSDQWLQ